MLNFESIIDQDRPVRFLTTLFLKEIIPHAMLFTGIEGVGKKTCAKIFAMLNNCHGKSGPPVNSTGAYSSIETTDHRINPCGVCKSCRKIESDYHPDIIFVKPTGHFIRINRIRELTHSIAMKPYEAKLRVVIISDAHTMTPEAGNALLKSLEEPPDRTIFILTAVQAEDLLPTIVSRCRQISFNPISLKNIVAILNKKKGLDPEDAMSIAVMANGSISKAMMMSKPTNKIKWIKHRNWLYSLVSGLICPGHPPGGGLQSVSTSLAFAYKLSQKPGDISESLEMIKSWLRDIIIYKYAPDKIINKDTLSSIQYVAKNVSARLILAKIDAVHTAQQNINLNSTLRLTLEIMMVRLAFDPKLEHFVKN